MNFAKLFGKHPFKPMKRHMKLAVAIFFMFKGMFGISCQVCQ